MDPIIENEDLLNYMVDEEEKTRNMEIIRTLSTAERGVLKKAYEKDSVVASETLEDTQPFISFFEAPGKMPSSYLEQQAEDATNTAVSKSALSQ